jgi:RNA polymerase sigma-70 factor (ECF subfamily)
MSERDEQERSFAGRRELWLQTCETARTKVYRGLIAMGAPRSDAEDALQDALEAAVRARVPATKPEGWLFVVAIRSWRRHRWRQRLFGPLETARLAASRSDREGELDLLAEIARLPERQRAVLVARHVLGLSQIETASALGMAPGTVGSLGHRAIKALRERLGE